MDGAGQNLSRPGDGGEMRAMRIGWIQGKDNWAFRFLCKRYQKALPEYQHIDLEYEDKEKQADILYVSTSHLLRYIHEKEKAIFHLDGTRMLE